MVALPSVSSKPNRSHYSRGLSAILGRQKPSEKMARRTAGDSHSRHRLSIRITLPVAVRASNTKACLTTAGFLVIKNSL